MIRRAAVPALAIALALVSCGSLEQPAAVVDGIEITNQHVASDVALYTTISGLAQQQCGSPSREERPASACARFVLDSLIQQIVIDRYARAHDLSPSASAVSREANDLGVQLGGGGVVAGALHASQVPQPSFRNLARSIVVLNAVQGSVASGTVSEADILDRYRKDIAQYTTIHVEQILLKSRADAERVYRQATQSGATENDFLRLARKFSIDPSAKQNSGDLGDVPAASLDQTFATAALALQPGEISRPVHTRFGWHVIRLVGLRRAPLRSVRRDIAQKLGQEQFDAWLESQLASLDVRVNPRYGRWEPATGVVPITSTATVVPTPTRSVIPPAEPPTSP